MPSRPGPRSAAQTPAPRSERIKGSSRNPPGSASETSSQDIELSDAVIEGLTEKMRAFNEEHPGKRVSLGTLKKVFRRGAGAFSSSHRPGMTRNGWAYARVNAFLRKRGGGKAKAAYVQDDDLMANGGIVDTDTFKNWFSGSKVVDKKGKSLVVYHGTPDIRGLRTDYVFKTTEQQFINPTAEGSYFFTDSYAMAKTYADERRAFDYQNAEGGVLSVYLSIKKPFDIDAKGQSWRKFKVSIDKTELVGTREIVEYAQKNGYDGIIVRNVVDYYSSFETKLRKPRDVYVAFNSNQIKLADGSNVTFDPENLDIRYADGGSVETNCREYIAQNEAVLRTGYYLDLKEFSSSVDPYGQVPMNLDYTLVTYNSGNQEGLTLIDTINPVSFRHELAKVFNIPSNNAAALVSTYIQKGKKLKAISDIEGDDIIVFDRDSIVCQSSDNGEMSNDYILQAADSIANALVRLGYDVKKGSYAQTSYGYSKYLYANYENRSMDNGGLGIKIRVSDHSTSNPYRISEEIHVYPAKYKMREVIDKTVKDVEFRLRKELFEPKEHISKVENVLVVGENEIYPGDEILNYEGISKRGGKKYRIKRVTEKRDVTMEYIQRPDVRYAEGGTTETEKPIMLPDTQASYEGLKPILQRQGYELRRSDPSVGRLAKGMTLADLALRHGMTETGLAPELAKGIKTEMEHTDDPAIAEAIAMDHLYESPAYYTKLKKMEQSFASGGQVRIPSTDPSTWGAVYQVGDQVRIRIDFGPPADNKDINTVWTIVSVQDAPPFRRPENVSGRLYRLNNNQDWEGKDLEPAVASTTAPVPSPPMPSNLIPINPVPHINPRPTVTGQPVPITPKPPKPAGIFLSGIETPTGEPSKLDFMQQSLVRTDAFKGFFGDWEKAAAAWLFDNKANIDKHYAGVSLAIDNDTLEPIVLFHGTSTAQEFYQFDILERNFQGDISRKRPYGYFAYNEEYSQRFTQISQRGTPVVQLMYHCFLSVKKPFFAIEPIFQSMQETEDVWIEEIAKRITQDQHGHKRLPQDVYEQRLETQRYITRQKLQGKFSGGITFPFWRYMATDLDSSFKYFLSSYKYDSIIYYENYTIPFDYNDPSLYTKAIAVFDPRQIKLADGRNIDFNPVMPDIRYDEGGRTAEATTDNPMSDRERVERTIFPWKYAQGGQVEGKGLKDGDDGKKGGYLIGRSHAQGGIKAFNVDTGQPLEVEGNEVIITKRAVLDDTKRLFEGEMLTNREILSRINQSGGGVSFAKGGVMDNCGCSGRKYEYGGLMMQDYDIIGLMSYPEQVVNTVQEQATRFADYLVRNLQPKIV